jgi:carboxylate-amine ligase
MLVCGCHVHVGVPDREEAIQVMNRVRVWLSPVLALSANSPFWLGDDTGYASFRSEVWRRWPMAGTPEPLSSYAEYEEVLDALIRTGSVDEPARIYWDVRPSAKFDTLEFRVTDVCMTVDEAVMVAGLVRALVQTCHRHALEGRPVPSPRPEILRAATWRAARFGLDGDLVDLTSVRAKPATTVVEGLLDFVKESLEDQGDWDEVAGIVRRTIACGTGAARQRQALEQGGRPEDVVDLITSETVAGT